MINILLITDTMKVYIYSLNEYISKNDCNILLSLINCSEIKEKELRENIHIKKVYALDFSGRFALGENKNNMMNEEFFHLNKQKLDKLRNDLCDEESKIQFDEFIHQKRFGNYRKRISHNPEYFDDEIISFSENEVFVDCGAFDGDTILSFIDNLRRKRERERDGDAPFKKIYSFEADSNNLEVLKKNLQGLKNIVIIPKGVYDHTGTLFFENEGTCSSRVVDGNGTKIEITTIDESVNNDDVTFIKMDIEGSELKALIGAEKTIKRCKPKLAICVYHRVEDIVTIPQYIQSLNHDYKLYFRNYYEQGTGSMIYAV